MQMGALSFRRVVAILATIALLLSGATSAVAGEPCGRMAAAASVAPHGGTPCGDDGKGPDRPMGTACAVVCFAKCPAPMAGPGASEPVWPVPSVVTSAAPEVGRAGIGVAPPLQPPKV